MKSEFRYTSRQKTDEELPRIQPKRLVLIHMSDDRLSRQSKAAGLKPDSGGILAENDEGQNGRLTSKI